jgi:hypothetical protein
MSKFSKAEVFIIASAAFLGGVVFSLFSSPRSGADNRKWISDNTDEIQTKVKTASRKFKNKNFPDLYEATEELGLTDDDLMTGSN